MDSLCRIPVSEFLERLGSDAPAPGGGSVAALAGAQAAALVSMVARITMAKKGQDAPGMQAALTEAERLARELVALVDRDTEAFLEVMSAYRLPREDEKRSGAIQAALRRAAVIPLEVARLAVEVMDLARAVLDRGIGSARTDAAVALLMAHTAVEGAALNVLVNLTALKDRDFVRETVREVTDLRRRGRDSVVLADTVFSGLLDGLPSV